VHLSQGASRAFPAMRTVSYAGLAAALSVCVVLAAVMSTHKMGGQKTELQEVLICPRHPFALNFFVLAGGGLMRGLDCTFCLLPF
jgi:hypothetical protein